MLYEVITNQAGLSWETILKKEAGFRKAYDHFDIEKVARITSYNVCYTKLLRTSNLLTIAGLKHINQLGIKIPEELAVVGFDKTDAFDLFYTTVSFVNQPIQELGEKAVQLLLKSIENQEHKEQIFLNGNLIINKSSI